MQAMRKSWMIVLLAPALAAGCGGGQEGLSPSNPETPRVQASGTTAPRLTVAMLRAIELERQQARDSEDAVSRHITPSPGDVAGLGGNVLGDVVAGLPGGAALGFGGQIAGGNDLGKAVGSTLGALVGSILGPIGSVVGSVAGGAAGTQLDHAASRPDGERDGGPVYIEGIDTGPLAAAPVAEPRPGANQT